MPDEAKMVDARPAIDRLRREMVSHGVSPETAAIATGLAAEYAQQAFAQGYSLGYDAGHAKAAAKTAAPQTPAAAARERVRVTRNSYEAATTHRLATSTEKLRAIQDHRDATGAEEEARLAWMVASNDANSITGMQ